MKKSGVTVWAARWRHISLPDGAVCIIQPPPLFPSLQRFIRADRFKTGLGQMWEPNSERARQESFWQEMKRKCFFFSLRLHFPKAQNWCGISVCPFHVSRIPQYKALAFTFHAFRVFPLWWCECSERSGGCWRALSHSYRQKMKRSLVPASAGPQPRPQHSLTGCSPPRSRPRGGDELVYSDAFRDSQSELPATRSKSSTWKSSRTMEIQICVNSIQGRLRNAPQFYVGLGAGHEY